MSNFDLRGLGGVLMTNRYDVPSSGLFRLPDEAFSHFAGQEVGASAAIITIDAGGIRHRCGYPRTATAAGAITGATHPASLSTTVSAGDVEYAFASDGSSLTVRVANGENGSFGDGARTITISGQSTEFIAAARTFDGDPSGYDEITFTGGWTNGVPTSPATATLSAYQEYGVTADFRGHTSVRGSSDPPPDPIVLIGRNNLQSFACERETSGTATTLIVTYCSSGWA